MKYKVIATLEQLNDIGISRDIRGMEVNHIHTFPTEYVEIEIDAPKEIQEILSKLGQTEPAHKENYDIPRVWLQEIKE